MSFLNRFRAKPEVQRRFAHFYATEVQLVAFWKGKEITELIFIFWMYAGHPGTQSVSVEGDDLWRLHLPHLVHDYGVAHGHLLCDLDPHHVPHQDVPGTRHHRRGDISYKTKHCNANSNTVVLADLHFIRNASFVLSLSIVERQTTGRRNNLEAIL